MPQRARTPHPPRAGSDTKTAIKPITRVRTGDGRRRQRRCRWSWCVTSVGAAPLPSPLLAKRQEPGTASEVVRAGAGASYTGRDSGASPDGNRPAFRGGGGGQLGLHRSGFVFLASNGLVRQPRRHQRASCSDGAICIPLPPSFSPLSSPCSRSGSRSFPATLKFLGDR